MASLLDIAGPRTKIWVDPPSSEKDGTGIEWVTKGELSWRADKDGMAKILGLAAARVMSANLVSDGHVQTGLLTESLASDSAVSVSSGDASIKPPPERESFIERRAGEGRAYMSFDDAGVGEAVQTALDAYAKQAIKSA